MTVAVHPPSIFGLFTWTEDELLRVRQLLGLRRYWSGPLYRALRRQYEAAVAGRARPRDLHEAEPLVDALPSTSYFVWLDRHIQDRTWQEVGAMVDARLPALVECLAGSAPDGADLGTLEELPAGAGLPEYYVENDFHRQWGGIWPDLKAAAVYALGARVIHVGRNDNFELHDAFAAALPVEQPVDVLDAACGFGKTTFSLKKRYPHARVRGLDLSAPCLRLARRMASEQGLDIFWRQGAAEDLPYPDASFDLVTVTMALHEMPTDTIYQVLREAYRVLRPGGTFVAMENRLIGEPLRDLLQAYHSEVIQEPFMNRFRQSDFAGYAAAAGFDTELVNIYPPGVRPGSETDPNTWATTWALLIARKDG